MSAPFVPALDTFAGGQMTDLPNYSGAYDPTALFEIVSPGNPNTAVNYSITLAQLVPLIISGSYQPTFVTSGSVYNSVATDTRILVNKTVGSPTSVVLLGGASYVLPVLVKDLKGDAATNPITVTFVSGTLDTLASITINNPFGYFWFNPLANGNFYDAAY